MSFRSHFSLFASCLCILVAGSAGSIVPWRQLQADDSVAAAIQKILRNAEPTLRQKRLFAVSVGGFTSIVGTSSGPEVQLKFAEAVQKLPDFKVNPVEYDVRISGRLEKLELSNALAVRIVAQMFDANNQPIGQFDGDALAAEVLGQEAVPRLLGITSNSTDADRNQRDATLAKDQQLDPSIIKGSEVFSGPNGKFSIEVLIKETTAKKQLRPVFPVKSGKLGNAFAEIPTGNVFAVTLRNYSSKEIAVNLTLDGISSFAFSTVRSNTVYWLVPAGNEAQPGVATIRGWDKDNTTSFEFKTVDFPESAARLLKIEPNEALGQICAQFSESLPASRDAISRSVGLGDEISDGKRSEARMIGDLQDTILVRYMRQK